MSLNVKLFCLLVALGCARTYEPFWIDCGSTGMTIDDVDVPGCSVSPCVIAIGKNVSISVNFTPSKLPHILSLYCSLATTSLIISGVGTWRGEGPPQYIIRLCICR